MSDFPKFEMPEFNIEEVMPESLTAFPIDKDIRIQTLRHAVERGGSDKTILASAARFEDYIHNGIDGAHDGETLDKVVDTLKGCGFTDAAVHDAISALQNAGILFRERRTDA